MKACRRAATTVRLSIPGSKETSELWEEIDAGDMPQVGGRLPQSDIDIIGAWIDSLTDSNYCD